MQDEFDDRQALEHDLRQAVERDEFKLVYQDAGPYEDARICAEWRHLFAGTTPRAVRFRPETFIPIAEELGLIVELGSIILRRACREATTWKQPLTIAVNLSPLQLQAPGLVEYRSRNPERDRP